MHQGCDISHGSYRLKLIANTQFAVISTYTFALRCLRSGHRSVRPLLWTQLKEQTLQRPGLGFTRVPEMRHFQGRVTCIGLLVLRVTEPPPPDTHPETKPSACLSEGAPDMAHGEGSEVALDTGGGEGLPSHPVSQRTPSAPTLQPPSTTASQWTPVLVQERPGWPVGMGVRSVSSSSSQTQVQTLQGSAAESVTMPASLPRPHTAGKLATHRGTPEDTAGVGRGVPEARSRELQRSFLPGPEKARSTSKGYFVGGICSQ